MTYQPKVYREQGGDSIVCTSGGTIRVPVQTLGTSQTATNLLDFGLSALTASTTGPTYTLPAPSKTGLVKHIAITAATSAASSVVVAAASTATTIGVSGDNQITITSTGTGAGVTLVSGSTTAWYMTGGSSLITAAQST